MTVTVDFVARGDTPNEWQVVLVESGPWLVPVDQHLRSLQERLYGCLDAILDGQLAEKFPQTMGMTILIRLDGYNLPEEEVRAFFAAFAEGVLLIDDYKLALAKSRFVTGISFELNLDSIH